MLNLYAIREANSGAWCTSSKHSSFSTTFDKNIAIFKQAANATAAVKELNRSIGMVGLHSYGWNLDGAPVDDDPVTRKYVPKTPVKFVVVVLNVTPQK